MCFILHAVKLAELSKNSFERKNVNWNLRVKTYFDHPSYIFSGVRTPQPPWSTPL